MLLALTLWRPWDWAIYSGHKPVENRDWAPPSSAVGRYLALHSGKKYDSEGAEWIRETFGLTVPGEQELPVGITAVVRLAGYYQVGDPDDDGNPWAFGPYCWQVADVVRLPAPVPIRGAQKLWRVPEAELQAVRRGWVAARRSAAP